MMTETGNPVVSRIFTLSTEEMRDVLCFLTGCVPTVVVAAMRHVQGVGRLIAARNSGSSAALQKAIDSM